MVEFVVAFFLSLPTGSLVEWLIHYAMHKTRLLRRTWLGRMHTGHHLLGVGQGWLREFRDYCGVGAVFALPVFALAWMLGALDFGIGWCVGTTLYAAMAAYCHQLSHDRPGLLWHSVHHDTADHNFGLTTPLWDWAFRTYRPTPASADRESFSLSDLLKIRWL
jgi:sterol desaturase/sphingolipid hydroxylase (fatty acid hydroxylase superfamily)